jgi:hypothetical protein
MYWWFDERLSMEPFWSQMTPYARKFGIDLTEIVNVYPTFKAFGHQSFDFLMRRLSIKWFILCV